MRQRRVHEGHNAPTTRVPNKGNRKRAEAKTDENRQSTHTTNTERARNFWEGKQEKKKDMHPKETVIQKESEKEQVANATWVMQGTCRRRCCVRSDSSKRHWAVGHPAISSGARQGPPMSRERLVAAAVVAYSATAAACPPLIELAATMIRFRGEGDTIDQGLECEAAATLWESVASEDTSTEGEMPRHYARV